MNTSLNSVTRPAMSRTFAMRTFPGPRGFTLVELLVVIAIIGVLIGMLLPAVQQVRESARRTTCLNNMRQLGIAALSYEESNNQFPPARSADRFLAWPVLLMPQLEQGNLFDLFELDLPYADQDPQALQQTMDVMFCPSRRPPMISVTQVNNDPLGACGDYAGNAGSSAFFPNDEWADFETPVDGVINSGLDRDNPVSNGQLLRGANGRYRMASLTDGASNTIIFGEKSVHRNFRGEHGGWGDGSIYNGDEPGAIMRLGGFGFSIVTDEAFDAPGPGTIPVWGSAHRQTCNFTFGDGSVQVIDATTSELTLFRLSSRNDGAVVSVSDD